MLNEKVMNRKKKIKNILTKKAKKANAKLHKSNKPKYISKAEREKLAQQESLDDSIESTPESE